ncbi:cytochrome o ubiquinol oxidase, subunit III [delta proteobacterium NaphS2]|nr:cytochrome o ubiquinol oxidase, subunit III [delta proteobacterium NaphS2]
MMTADAKAMNWMPGESEHVDTVEIRTFGFWVYLMSDLALFSALFATFAVVGFNYAGGPSGKDLFHLPYLFGETMLLLVSSAACGFTMLAVHGGRKARVQLGLVVTFLLGLGFITMEIHEFYGMVAGGNGPERSAFLSAFFTLVGTHGIHVSFGLIWMAVLMGQVTAKGLSTPVRSRLMRLSMFWHFLDIVWVGVFSVVYLMGVI